jgi:hypothetical protein
MTRRILGVGGLSATLSVGVLAFTALVAVPVSGQSPAAPPLVITAYNGGAPIPYTVPRTPWGEPDLQGTWSSDDATMPLNRPNVDGKPNPNLYLTDEQFTARQKQITDGVRNAEENATSTFRNDFARRAFRQTSLIVDPPTGQMPPQTAEAKKRAAPRDRGTFGDGPFDSVRDFTLYDRCITRGIVGSTLRVIYGNGNRIVQAPGMVAISYEMIHDTRVIYTDGRPQPAPAIRQYLGSSRGRWEGDELVVETTNLTDETSIGLNGNGLRHSDRMRLTERIKRVAADIVQYQVTIDDPVTYARPFTISMPLTPLDGGMLLPYDCHEGNLAIRQSLGAERAEDAALAADLAKGIKRERRGVQESGTGGGGGGRRGGGAGARGGGPPAAPPPDGDQER